MGLDVNKIILKASLFSLMLLPSLQAIPGFPKVRLDDILLLFWLLIFLRQGRVDVPHLATRRFYIISAFLFLFPISMLNGLMNGYEASFDDFNQFVRFLKYISMYLLAVTVWKSLGERQTKEMLRFILSCGIGLFVIAVFQYFDLFGLNNSYVHIIAPTQYETLVNNYPTPRPVGMIGNPNELGFMFAMLSLLAIFCVLFFRQKIYFLVFLLLFLGTLMTMSRGSMLGLASGLLAFTAVYLWRRGFIGKLKVSVMAFAITVILAVIVMLPPVYNAYTWRIERALNISDSSVTTRFDNWSENISLIKEHPILGVGPLRRAEFEHAADNEWLLIWRSYGIFGVFLLITLFLSSLFSRMILPVKAMYLALIFASFVYMVPTAVFHSLTLFPLLLSLIAFIDVKGRDGGRVRL